MPHACQIHKQEGACFMTLTTVEWVDLVIREKYKQMICESLNYCMKKKGLEIFCYVIMTSPIHLITRTKNSELSKVMRDFKKFTSGTLINEIRLGRESRKECLPAWCEAGRAAENIRTGWRKANKKICASTMAVLKSCWRNLLSEIHPFENQIHS